MAYDLKKIMAEKPSRFTEGHRMCAGCGAPVVARMVLIIITAIIPAVTAIRQKLQQLLHRRLPPLPRQIAIPMLIRLQLINYKILLKILLIKHY